MEKGISYCSHCGSQLEKGARFCSSCGKAILESKTENERNHSNDNRKRVKNPRRQIVLGIIAGLVLTAVCSPLVLFARGQVRGSLLNPQNRFGADEISSASLADLAVLDPTDTSTPYPTQEPPSGDEGATSTPLATETPTPPQNNPTPGQIQVELIPGNALNFTQPPSLVAYADDQAGTIPAGVQLAPFCQTGCFRYNGWLGLMKPGDSYDVIFTEPTSFIGLQFWGDPGDGIAHVYLDGKKVWEGPTEGKDANYPGGAFVNYLQMGNLPEIANHILRIETDSGGGSVVIYFFGSGPVVP